MDTDRRKSQRYVTDSLIAVTSKGIAQVVNLSTKSVFFRFTGDVHFPDYSAMDLYDSIGLNMVGVLAKKVWNKTSTQKSGFTPFKSEVVVEFQNLSPSQEYQLRYYLRQQLEHV